MSSLVLRRWLSVLDRRARLPEGVRIYAFGDIHGCADLLREAFRLVDEDVAGSPAAQVIQVFLGDYVDRGPSSKETLDLLIDRGLSHRSVYVMGNHEALMLDFLRDPDVLEGWQQLGGAATLLSYGLRPPATVSATAAEALRSGLVAALPDWHLRFLNLLAPSFACGDFFFTHAGVRPGVPLEEQKPEDLMWIRQEFLQSRLDFGKVVVHGHTPVRAPEIHDHRVNIDTGAYATGRLTVLRIDGHDLRFLVSERRR